MSGRTVWTVATATLVATAALASAGTASAQGPYVTQFTLPATYVDDTLCSFDVDVNGVDTVTEQDFPDGTVVFHDVFSGTVTANGVTLDKLEDANISWGADGSETWKGLAEEYTFANGDVLAADRGVISWDADGDLVAEHGPHPIADGPGNDAVCAVLAGG